MHVKSHACGWVDFGILIKALDEFWTAVCARGNSNSKRWRPHPNKSHIPLNLPSKMDISLPPN